VKTVVLSAPGREAITEATLLGLARQNPGASFDCFRSRGGDPIRDFWGMLSVQAAHGEDLLALEDDIVTARNFIPYAARWSSSHMTSFFFLHGGGLQVGRPESPATFGGNQALWFPARLVRELARCEPRREPGWLQDNALSYELVRLGELVVYHRSLVQHVGNTSLCRPGRPLGHIVAPDFPGEDFDCLEAL
jgi:hypothetical protein